MADPATVCVAAQLLENWCDHIEAIPKEHRSDIHNEAVTAYRTIIERERYLAKRWEQVRDHGDSIYACDLWRMLGEVRDIIETLANAHNPEPK